ncbi:MAG TPA: NYN domain-containing protein, partial [Nitrososphaeraceae archaeon]|nr:NYN domain-containing protein [Nitrososphaeraceae archaeon]
MTSGIFIDGGYIGEITKKLNARLDFERVRDFVRGKSEVYGTYYYYAMPYQSSPPTADESDRFSKTDKFLDKLRQIPNFEVKLGKTQRVFNSKTRDYDYNQKMVDVMLAVDLVRLSM